MSGRPVSELKATTRISAPSSARTLLSMRSAIELQRPARRRARRRRGGRACAGSPGAWRGRAAAMSATSPASKRSRRRSSSACRSRGGRSEVSTIWRPPSCSALKVWKNSSSVRVLRSRNWTSSSSSTSTSRKRALKASVRPPPSASRNSLVNASPVVQRTVRPGLWREQQGGDRAEQVGLADAGRAADEQRVVGLRGHLGDGQRGGVGEAVAVADDELVEGQLGVAERARARAVAWRRAPALACSAPVASGARAARRRVARRPATCPLASLSRALDAAVLDELDDACRARGRCAAQASRTRPKRSWIQLRAVRGRLRAQRALVELERPQRLEPDAIGGLVDGAGRARLARATICARARRSRQRESASLPEEVDRLFERGARGPRSGDYNPRLSAAFERLAAIGGKITPRRSGPYT